MIVKIISILMFILSLLPLIFALVVHLANNAKGYYDTIYDWKINLSCLVVFIIFFLLGMWFW